MQAFFFLLRAEGLAHFRPTRRPASRCSIVNRTLLASESVYTNVVPFFAAAALTPVSAVPLGSTAKVLFVSRAATKTGAVVSGTWPGDPLPGVPPPGGVPSMGGGAGVMPRVSERLSK